MEFQLIHRVKILGLVIKVWKYGTVWLDTNLFVDNVEFLYLNVMGVSTSKVGSIHLF